MINELMNQYGGYVAMWLLILLAVFLICREIFCWYFKFNEQVGLLKDIRAELAGLSQKLGATVSEKQ